MSWFRTLLKGKLRLRAKFDTDSARPAPDFLSMTPKVAAGFQPVLPAKSFTPRATQVLALARKQAESMKHPFIGTEHLLLGLIQLDRGVAATVLIRSGLDLEATRRAVFELNTTPVEDSPLENIPYTQRLKNVLALANLEADVFNHTYVGTEHLLLGLLREDDGPAARISERRNINAAVMRDQIESELRPTVKSLDLLRPTDIGEANFTANAREVVNAAWSEADRMRHNFLGTEHLLLGLITTKQGKGLRILKRWGVDPIAVRIHIGSMVGFGPDPRSTAAIPMTPRVRKILDLAAREAKSLKRELIGTEHLLLGILREGAGVGALVLEGKITPDQVLQEIGREYAAG